MKKFIQSFLCIAMLSAVVAIEADSCCVDSCNVSCADSCGDCGNSCGNSCNVSCSDSCFTGTAGCNRCHSTPIYRSINDNLMRRDQLYINAGDSLYDNDCFKAILGLDFEYMRSFKSKKLARGLFGSNALVFSGSSATVRQAGTLIADNFGLSEFLPATALYFSPRVSNFIVDFRAHFALDNWVEGLYFTVNAPFAHAEWQLNPSATCGSSCGDCNNSCFDNCNVGCSTGCNGSLSSCCVTPTGVLNGTPFLCGYMATATPCTTAILPATSFQQALSGDYLFGDMQTPWQFGRFTFCKQSKNAVAGVDMLLGYNAWRCEDHHVGVYLRAVAPTGNKPNPRNVFSPVVGYGKHWELGAGMTAHWKMWNCDADQDLVAYADFNITHLFSNCQTRSFDFQGKGCLSRYMLLKSFNAAGNYVTGTGLINGINFATRNAQVSIAVKGEAMLELVYRHGGFRFGLGGDVWGMSHEKVCIRPGAACSTLDTTLNYGIKGCEGVAARSFNIVSVGGTATIFTEATPVALNSTASAATITSCSNRVVDNGVFLAASNTAGTTVALDYTSATPVLGVTTAAAVFDGGFVAPYVGALTSTPPVYVTVDDLDPKSAANPGEVSGSVFGTASYAWTDCDWTPVLGLGASGEFSGHNGTLNQWGIWVNGSVTF